MVYLHSAINCFNCGVSWEVSILTYQFRSSDGSLKSLGCLTSAILANLGKTTASMVQLKWVVVGVCFVFKGNDLGLVFTSSSSLIHALSVDTSTCANISDHNLISFDLIPTNVYSPGILPREIYINFKADIVNLSEYLSISLESHLNISDIKSLWNVIKTIVCSR